MAHPPQATQPSPSTFSEGFDCSDELNLAGGSAAGLANDKGKVSAIPAQYDELAQAVEPVLERSIKQIDERINKLADLQTANEALSKLHGLARK